MNYCPECIEIVIDLDLVLPVTLCHVMYVRVCVCVSVYTVLLSLVSRQMDTIHKMLHETLAHTERDKLTRTHVYAQHTLSALGKPTSWQTLRTGTSWHSIYIQYLSQTLVNLKAKRKERHISSSHKY